MKMVLLEDVWGRYPTGELCGSGIFEESEALAAFTRQAAGLDDGATATGDESERKEDDDSSSDEDTTNFPGSRYFEPQSSRLALAETAMTGGRQPPHHHGFLSILASCCRCLAVQLAIRFFIATDQHPTTSSVHDILHDAANSPIRTSADSTNYS
uniref:Uncharacterized protein n=1 Tax=Panagrellus redivivus TaxID=6233 RepID=A0A7E4VUJ8_PANRE